MSDLTEQEILDCFRLNVGAAIDWCHRLARGERGRAYPELVTCFEFIEGCARQMAAWREDTRWLAIGLTCFEVHKRCGNMLRMRAPTRNFEKLAILLETMKLAAADLELKATGIRGAILPEVQQPTEMRQRQGRVILPPGFEDKREKGETVH